MTYRPPFPEEADVLQSWLTQHSAEIRTAMPGKVVRWDAAKQVADVQPLVRHPVEQPDGTSVQEDQPVVPSVPMIFPRMGSWFVSFPVEVGDTVLLICCEGAIGHWRAGNGEVTDPGDQRRHHLSHAVAIPGLVPKSKALANASATSMMLGHDGAGARIEMKLNGEVIVDAGAVKVALTGDRVNVGTLTGTAGPYPVNFSFTPADADGAPGAPSVGPSVTLGGYVRNADGSPKLKAPR